MRITSGPLPFVNTRPCCEAEPPGHLKDCWTLRESSLPWYESWHRRWFKHSPFPTRRCKAHTGDKVPFGGRCELSEHESWVSHARYGQDVAGRLWLMRWTSEWQSQHDVVEPEVA